MTKGSKGSKILRECVLNITFIYHLKQIFCLEQQALQHSLQDEEWENGQEILNRTIGSIYSKKNCKDQNLHDFIWAAGAWKLKEPDIGKQILVVIPGPSTEVVDSPAPVATLEPQAASLRCIIHGGTQWCWAMVMKGKRKVVISRPQLADWKPKCDVVVIVANFLVYTYFLTSTWKIFIETLHGTAKF